MQLQLGRLACVLGMIALAWLAVSGNTYSQLRDSDPDWVELEAPAPPPFDAKRLVTFDLV